MNPSDMLSSSSTNAPRQLDPIGADKLRTVEKSNCEDMSISNQVPVPAQYRSRFASSFVLGSVLNNIGHDKQPSSHNLSQNQQTTGVTPRKKSLVVGDQLSMLNPVGNDKQPSSRNIIHNQQITGATPRKRSIVSGDQNANSSIQFSSIRNLSPKRLSLSQLSDGSSTRRLSQYTRRNSIQRPSSPSISKKDSRRDLDDDPSSSEDDADLGADTLYDARREDQLYREARAGAIYEEQGKLYHGSIDRRGITPYVTFHATETPPSKVVPRTIEKPKQPICGFCSSTNLIWILRCSFCGCTRMSDAPRLKYFVDMILSVDPTISPSDLVKKILDFAKFDHVALQVEKKFKQASLLRAKAAIMMMNRAIYGLRMQIASMIFHAWNGNRATQQKEDALMQRLIRIKNLQMTGNYKLLVFRMWKGYAARVVEERTQRFMLALKRNDMTKLRRIFMAWITFMRIRGREKMHQLRAHYDAERNETPNVLLKEIDQLQETLSESRKLLFTATNTIIELLHQSTRNADHDILKMLQLEQMHPTTISPFIEAVHGHKILEGLSSGHIAASSTDDFEAMDDQHAQEMLRMQLTEARNKVDQMSPSDSLIQWLNFQRKRAVEVASLRQNNMSSKPSNSTLMTSSGAVLATNLNSTIVSKRSVLKLKDKKKKEVKEIKGLQDLRTHIASPGVMLKLLCHTFTEAQSEYERLRSTTDAAAAAAENSTTSTALTPAAQVQLKAYFKLANKVLNLPPDLITRDAFMLNDFDALYPYVVYIYLVHPNYIAPSIALAPQYHLNYHYLTPQWEKIQELLNDDFSNPLAQQQYYIFLAKIKRVNKYYERLQDICHAVNTIGQWHQISILRDIYNDFTRRGLGKESMISIALEKETSAAWVSLSPTKLLHMCENEDELRAIEQVFKDNVLELIKIFRIYGTSTGGKGILEQEFLKVMTRAGITDKKNILRSTLQVIYQQSRQQATSTNANGIATTTNGSSATTTLVSPPGTSSGITQNTVPINSTPPPSSEEVEEETLSDERGATLNEFFEALVRVAHYNLQKRKERASEVSGTLSPDNIPLTPLGEARPQTALNGNTLFIHVVEIVMDKILPLTKKFQEQGLLFKKQMVNPDVQTICKAQEKKLKRVFLTYSNRNKNPLSRGKFMALSEFEGLLKEKRLIDAFFAYGKVKQLIAFVQQEDSAATNGTDGDTEFGFAEFVEALAAIAVYRNANPYVPLAKKLELFLEESF